MLLSVSRNRSNSTNDEFESSNGFVISDGTYDRSLRFLRQAASEAKRDFPHLTDADIEPFIITKSTYNKNFAGIRFPLPGGTTKPGYRVSNKLDFSHS